MNIKKLEKIFEKDDLTILKELRPYWNISYAENLSDNSFQVFEIKIKNNKIHVVKNLKTNEFSFVLKEKDIRNIFNIKDIIPFIEGKKPLANLSFI